jgi:hypothetical protein
MKKVLFATVFVLLMVSVSFAGGLLVDWDTPTISQQGLYPSTDKITGYAVYIDNMAPVVVPAKQTYYLITNPIPDHAYSVTVTVLFMCQGNWGLTNCEGVHSDPKTYKFISIASTAPQWVVLK